MPDSNNQYIGYNIERMNLCERIADNLERMIVTDASQIGRKLPSEQTLANNFGVSRNVIREAFKILKERQLISVHTGEGAYIEKPNNRGVADILNRIIQMDSIDTESVFEMRSLLEIMACRLAADRNSPENFDELERINETMCAQKDDTESRIQNDLDFHQAIAALSRNPLLELFVKSMNSLLRPILRTALIPSGGNEDGIEFHRQIIRALRSGDGNAAAEMMRSHLEKSTANYLHGHVREEAT